MLARDQWQRLSAGFDELVELGAVERATRLAALRAQEPALAERLARMLDSADQAAESADPSAAAAPAQGFQQRLARALAAEPRGGGGAAAGERLGPWRLVSKLGEGGMGEVWLAERADGLYQAQVAIKLLRDDVSAPGLAERFARERAVLARLTHPGIARLLDAGVQAQLGGGRAYLVLEHVAGLTLSEHVRQARLPVAERVRLLLGVARAVEHAHAQLIVHRDLKPSNVMVTAEGSPKLLDFGIAGLLDDEGASTDSQLTRQAGRRLTPAYAAPEQITGAAIGVAADVYSLGVMLYELLSGVLPFGQTGGSRTALEHAVLHTEPARLSRSTLPPEGQRPGPGRPPDFERTRGDLEAVAAKAMRKQPGQRYGSVGAFIDDLQRWLEHRPVSARRDDWRHRSRLWLRRHAKLAIAALLLGASLSAGLAISLWQWQRAEAAARQSEQVTRYLTELLASANPDRHGGRPPTVLELLERSRAELGDKFADDPATRARLLDVLVGTYRDLNRYDIAIPLAQQLIEHAQQHFGSEDERTLNARMGLARIYTSQGSPAKVIALVEPLQADLIARHGEVSHPHSAALYLLGVAYSRVGRLDEAEQALARARPIVDELYKPSEFEHMFFDNYVQSLRVAQGRLAEAEALLLATEPRWATAQPRYARFVLVLRRNLLAVQIRRAKYAGIEVRANALLGEMEALLGPGNDMAAGMRAELARYYADRGEHGRALQLHEQIQSTLSAAAVEHPTLRLPQQAALLQARAMAAPVNAALRTQAGALLEEIGATPAVSGPARVEACLALLRVGLLGQDLALADRALTLAQADPVLQTSTALRSRSEQLRGQLLRARGDLAGSRAALERRIAYLDALPEPQQVAAWTAQLDLAATLVLLREPGAAAALARADALRPASLPDGHELDALRRALGEGGLAPGFLERRL